MRRPVEHGQDPEWPLSCVCGLDFTHEEKTMSIITRSRRILNLGPVEPDDGPVHFVQYDEEAGGDGHTLCAIPHALWVDMGSPETITLTVEPGDLLNAAEGYSQ